MIAKAMSADHQRVMTADAYEFLCKEFSPQWVKAKFFIAPMPLSLDVIKDVARTYKEMEKARTLEPTSGREEVNGEE